MNISSDASFFTMATSIFLILNATGQIPLFLAMLARFDHARQMRIIIREMIAALIILLMFTFFGDGILGVMGISRPVIGIAGGILLFPISLTMIFPKTVKDDGEKAMAHEPMIIPLAIPA